jgi:O-antigen ligase
VIFLLFPSRPDLSTFFLFAFGLAAFLAKRNSIRPGLARMDVMVVSLFVVVACVSVLFSDDVPRSARYLVYLVTNIFLLLLVSALPSRLRWRIVSGTLAFLGLIHLGALLISHAAIGPASPEAIIEYQPFATMLVPNDALLLGLCLPAIALLYWESGSRWKRTWLAVLAAYVLLSVYASYLLQSKVTLISLLAAIIALLAAWRLPVRGTVPSSRFLSQGMALVTTLLLIIGAAWYLGNQSTTRLGLWSHALSSTEGADVLTGTGPNTFSYDPSVVETRFEEGEKIIPWVHNVLLESYTEQGLPGLIVLLAMILIPLTRATKIEDPGTRAYLFASVLTFFLLGLLEITLTRRFCFAFLMLGYGLSCAPAPRKTA